MTPVPQVIGTISGSGKITLKDKNQAAGDPTPVDLDLEKVLGDMPRKTYSFSRRPAQLEALDLPEGTKPGDALHQVLKLPSVHSKRFLTTKVDRCVTGRSRTIGQYKGHIPVEHDVIEDAARVAGVVLTASKLALAGWP